MKTFIRVLCVAVVGGLSALVGCGQTQSSDGTDSNTHWLKACEDDSDCGSLACFCGVCSQPCTSAGDCRGLSVSASCSVPSACAAEAARAVCLQEGGGGGGGAVDDPCAPLDARSSGDDCVNILGYTFNGKLCEPVSCGCVGRECDALYGTAEECDSAYRSCYEESGLGRACDNHADCQLAFRACCSTCGNPQANDLMALSAGSPTPLDLGLCLGDPSGSCPACASGVNPSVYSACVAGECRVLDLYNRAGCATDEQCRLSTKDCCECNADVSAWGLVAVNPTFVSHDYCDDDLTCSECGADYGDATATCDVGSGLCTVVLPTSR